jgi:hypothetical protein
VMPVPYIVDGDSEAMLASLARLKGLALENVVQGHGEIILRGEISEAINSSINYLTKMQAAAATALTLNQSRDDMLREYDIESCGKSRIALNGLVQQLHAANLITMYDRFNADQARLLAGRPRVAQPATKPAEKAKSKAVKKVAATRSAKPAPRSTPAAKKTTPQKAAAARRK